MHAHGALGGDVRFVQRRGVTGVVASAQIARLDVKSLKNPPCFDSFEKFAKTSVKKKTPSWNP